MPKKIQAVNEGKFTESLDVPQPGEPRIAANIETPIRILLNNLAYLLKLNQDLANLIAAHGHALANASTPGFMSPGDKQKLDGLSASVAAHAHAIVTTTAPGFMSKEDKVKLNGIETGAQTVTSERVLNALDIKRGSILIPESAFSAGQIKFYTANVAGAKYDAPVVASETGKSDFFFMHYHVEDNKVIVGVRNMKSTSATFPGGEAHFAVFNNLLT